MREAQIPVHMDYWDLETEGKDCQDHTSVGGGVYLGRQGAQRKRPGNRGGSVADLLLTGDVLRASLVSSHRPLQPVFLSEGLDMFVPSYTSDLSRHVCNWEKPL